MDSIRYLRHDEIDTTRWDRAMLAAINGNLYGWSWYLDTACPGWDALVTGDYQAMMPLPLRKKFGITYLYQPFFMQQTGIYSLQAIKPETTTRFLSALPPHIRYADYNLNFHNLPSGNEVNFERNTTYHLDLIPDYPLLRRNFPENTRRNIKKASQAGLSISKGMQINTLIRFKQQTAVSKISDAEYDKLRQLVSRSVLKGAGVIYGAYTASNELCAAAFFAFSHEYVYMLVAASDNAGKENSAMFLLVDTFLQEHAGRPLTLDFEGSNIPGIARFFAGFGAMPVYYYKVRMNRLPFYIKWLKK